jgi:hypothetical protein
MEVKELMDSFNTFSFDISWQTKDALDPLRKIFDGQNYDELPFNQVLTLVNELATQLDVLLGYISCDAEALVTIRTITLHTVEELKSIREPLVSYQNAYQTFVNYNRAGK